MENGGDLILGMKILQRGWITSAQLRAALVEHARGMGVGGRAARSLGVILMSEGFVSPEQLASLMGETPAPQLAPPTPPPIDTDRLVKLFDAPHAALRFGKYTLKREIGRGSMGLVFEAVDTLLGRTMALKRPFSLSGGRAPNRLEEERFFVEAGLASLIPKHPGLVEVFEAGRIDGQCYLAMEYIEGRPMSEWRKAGTLQQEISVIGEVARAVHHAHEHGVIHRDLKPENIMIRPNGHAVVTDFGVAKSAMAQKQISLTPVGFTVGSPGYMSPEQARGLKHVDRTTDVYSLGVMLYETLTGRRPFQGRSAMEILIRMVHDPIRRPSEIMRAGLNPLLYQELESVCLKALAREPRHRYQTAKDFADDLECLTPSASVVVPESEPALGLRPSA
jgi:serine/threonine-protein kinase